MFQIRRFLDHANTVTLCIFSTILFSRVLVRVAWNQLLQERRSKHETSDDTNAEQRVQRLLDLITKYTILALWIVFISLAVIVMDEMTTRGITLGFTPDDWLSMLF